MGEISNRNAIKMDEVKRFIVDCFVAMKTTKKHAESMADMLVTADYRGHYSHGLNRLEVYLNDIKTGAMDANVEPTILKETPATALVNGNNGLGPVVGRFCMDLAIKKAKNVGIGWVCANNCNHYGIAGLYAIQAQQQGLIGLSMTNTSPCVCPTRTKETAVGTNPISLAAPAKNGDSFVLDMATSAVAFGKIEMQHLKNEPIPAGWALGEDGNVTTDAAEAVEAKKQLPLGGLEVTSGYKGYGLISMVEVLTGILSGANFASKIRQWAVNGSADGAANLGQVFIAIDPNCFAPGFDDRMTEFNSILRNLPPMEAEKPVLVPGDPERMHMEKVDKMGGIQYHVNRLNACNDLAERLNVPRLGSL